jgi:hypothetical protein
MPDREVQPEPHLPWRRLTGIGWFGKPAVLMSKLDTILAKLVRVADRERARSAIASLIDARCCQGGNCFCRKPLPADHLDLSTGADGVFVAGFFICIRGGRITLTVFTRNLLAQLSKTSNRP